MTFKNVFDSKRDSQIRGFDQTALRLFCWAYLVLEMEQFGQNLQQIVGGANLGFLTLLNTQNFALMIKTRLTLMTWFNLLTCVLSKLR
jgi:hypothetical protein